MSAWKFNPNLLQFKNNGGNGNNNGNKSRKERRRDEQHKRRSMRDYDDRSFDDLDTDDEFESSEESDTDNEIYDAISILDVFIEDFTDIIQEPGNKVPNIIRDQFWDVCSVMTHYYDNKYKDLVGKMNKVLEIVSRQIFAKSLQMVCAGDDIEGWNGTNGIWKDVLFTLSTALITSYSKMKTEVASAYIDLIASNGLAGKDIAMLTDKYGITKDLSIDLITAIPVIPEDLNDITIGQFHDSFIMRIMDNAEENIDVLDGGTQSKLFTFFFGEGQQALKTIGRMLADTAIGAFKNNSQQMIYAEYVSMLAKRLDAYDIKNIKYVLKYVVGQKKVRANDELVYDNISVAEYDSIRKALFELIADNPEVKKILTS